jgi:hypothetical protein
VLWNFRQIAIRPYYVTLHWACTQTTQYMRHEQVERFLKVLFHHSCIILLCGYLKCVYVM